ncbi:vWA domain-containing protein [Roseicyclus persicicus]|uniref:VWA domain-containing protein n=1 Tax=Roseicyclus persicicus TaxID=2650661 RepID=A0A7X6GY66_9RHOB|nr:VWA domain-containing protein [Roseibacterium persicicum]NKX44508.1 VWA domain-containing protein [Roseibacterium persicicum]
MAPPRPLPETAGRLAENIVHFARALRKAGVRVGPAQVQSAVEAVAAAGFTHKTDFYHVLRATLIHRAEHLELFDQCFALFWRDPEFIEQMIHLMSPTLRTEAEARKKKAAERRAAEALADAPEPPEGTPVREELEMDARISWSASEKLRSMDFEQMSAAEIAEATRAVRALHLPVKPVPTRRTTPSPHGTRPDLRGTLRRAMRRGGEVETVLMRQRRSRPPDLVALCDISGSMSVYSRMLVHFLHAITWAPDRGWGKVHVFTFGTRLTNITRALAQKDPDLALAAAGRDARDWEGGTRIGEAIRRFNVDWSRRVLGQGAVVLLISDGLERGDTSVLEAEIARLRLSCRQIIWLNPLLRWDGFEPRAGGIRAILPHVDRLHACHSLDSLDALSAAMSGARGTAVKTVASRPAPAMVDP